MPYHEASKRAIPELKLLLREALREDGSAWDFTTLSLGEFSNHTIRAQVRAKSSGVWVGAGLIEATQIIAQEELGDPLKIKSFISDGQTFKKGLILCEWTAKAQTVLILERPFLNLASFSSGIATRTRALKQILEKAWKKNKEKKLSPPRLTPTRKTLPHYRDLSLLCAEIGGATPHRVGLNAGVLFKENHLASFSGSIESLILQAKKTIPHGLKVEIEVRTFKEFQEAVSAQAEVVMLDNFTPMQVKKTLKWLKSQSHQPLIEVSGGINEKTIAQYVIPGVHILSSGVLTYSPAAVDLSLLVLKS